MLRRARDLARQVRGDRPAAHVVAGGDRAERPGVVDEAGQLGVPGRLDRGGEVPGHCVGRVEEPPWGAEVDGRVVAGERARSRLKADSSMVKSTIRRPGSSPTRSSIGRSPVVKCTGSGKSEPMSLPKRAAAGPSWSRTTPVCSWSTRPSSSAMRAIWVTMLAANRSASPGPASFSRGAERFWPQPVRGLRSVAGRGRGRSPPTVLGAPLALGTQVGEQLVVGGDTGGLDGVAPRGPCRIGELVGTQRRTTLSPAD